MGYLVANLHIYFFLKRTVGWISSVKKKKHVAGRSHSWIFRQAKCDYRRPPVICVVSGEMKMCGFWWFHEQPGFGQRSYMESFFWGFFHHRRIKSTNYDQKQMVFLGVFLGCWYVGMLLVFFWWLWLFRYLVSVFCFGVFFFWIFWWYCVANFRLGYLDSLKGLLAVAGSVRSASERATPELILPEATTICASWAEATNVITPNAPKDLVASLWPSLR